MSIAQRLTGTIDQNTLKSMHLTTPSTVMLVEQLDGASMPAPTDVPPLPCLPKPLEINVPSQSLPDSSTLATEFPPPLPMLAHESRVPSPVPSHTMLPVSPLAQAQQRNPSPSLVVPEQGLPPIPIPLPRTPTTPSSPTRARSMNDMVSRFGESSRGYDTDMDRTTSGSNVLGMKGSSKSEDTLPNRPERRSSTETESRTPVPTSLSRAKSIKSWVKLFLLCEHY